MMVEEFVRDGVWVSHARPADASGSARPPLVFVHGGAHASWCWEFHVPFFVDRGWECLTFDWFNHGRSTHTDAETFRRRGIAEVATEIGIVAGLAGRPPVLVGHSMGAGAAQVYAADNDLAGLVLLAPVVPAAVGAEPLALPVPTDDLVPPFPAPLARQLFFTSLDDESARHYTGLLCPESGQAVLEATKWTLDVDLDAISAPTLVVAGGRDALCPHPYVRTLAAMLDAQYLLLDDAGHDDVLLHDGTWQVVADRVHNWLADMR